MPNDRRNRKTKTSIENSFIALLTKKNISKITVKEICEKADINRGTFYLHYTDVYQLSETIENRILKNIENIFYETMKNMKTEQHITSDFIVSILDHLKKNKSFILALNENASIDDFTKKFSQFILDITKSEENFEFEGDETLVNYVVSYFIGATSGIVANWLNNGCNVPSQKIADMIFHLTSFGINYYK